MKCRATSRRRRHASAVIELAVCLPAIVLLVTGAIECCSMIFLRQALQVTAYEGIRVAIRREADSGDVVARCEQILAERGISDALVTLDPTDPRVVRGTPIRLSISAPCGTNSILRLQFFTNSNVTGTATMIKE